MSIVAQMVTPADERRHPPGAGRDWEESWYLDFVHAGGGSHPAQGAARALAGFVRLTVRPAERTAWFWAGMVGGGPALVTVRDHEVTPPVAGGLEVRASGLWTEFVCETPLDHWSVGLEAFGVALDDPLEAWGQERGDPWALGLDVEWEAAGECTPWEGDDAGYWQGCAVHGDVLVGAERFALDGAGTRVHTWGDRARSRSTGWAAGRLGDGTDFLIADPAVECDDRGLLRTVAAGVAVAHAPVLVPGAGRLARALCRYDGEGYGWAEWFHPAGASELA
jgi:hypothetical protein